MNLFFILSFIPAVTYWLVEIYYDEQIAIICGLVLAVIELSLEKILTKKVHSLSVLNAGLLVFLGVMAFIFQEGILFKLQPTFTGVVFFVVFFWKTKKGESYFNDILKDMGRELPPKLMWYTEVNLAYFMLLYGFFMAYIALYYDTGTWLFFKTGGFYLAMIIFMIGNTFYLRSKQKNSGHQ